MPISGHPICRLPCLKGMIFSTLMTVMWMTPSFWIEAVDYAP
jgi:hypothetical protein